jgi:hypothetical protein
MTTHRANDITTFNCKAVAHGFDVTPARLVTGLITERGICAPNEAAILAMFGDLVLRKFHLSNTYKVLACKDPLQNALLNLRSLNHCP